MVNLGIFGMDSKEQDTMKTIGIYSYNIYYLFTTDQEKGTGGAEYQLIKLAKLLKARGYEIVFFVGDVFAAEEEIIDSFRFIKCVNKNNKHFIDKLKYLIQGLIKGDIDILLERGSSNFSLVFALYSLLFRIKYVFSGASDINFAKDEIDPAFQSKFHQRLFLFSLRLAKRIIVQKKSQQHLVKKNLNLHSEVINNFPPDLVSEDSIKKLWDVVWVSNIIPYKNPEIFIEIACVLPNYNFLMIGGARDENYFKIIKESAFSVPNLTFMGFIRQEEVSKLIKQSRILINTTIVKGKYEEGFPNSFLQAWQVGVPVVSLISNPDNILENENIGICSKTTHNMVNDIRSLLESSDLYNKLSNNSKAYIEREHDENYILKQYLGVLE